jgi:hypothetical protein
MTAQVLVMAIDERLALTGAQQIVDATLCCTQGVRPKNFSPVKRIVLDRNPPFRSVTLTYDKTAILPIAACIPRCTLLLAR